MNVLESLINVYSHWHPGAQFFFPLILAVMALSWSLLLLRGYPTGKDNSPD